MRKHEIYVHTYVCGFLSTYSMQSTHKYTLFAHSLIALKAILKEFWSGTKASIPSVTRHPREGERGRGRESE